MDNKPVIVKFKKLHPDAVIPTKATVGSACFDITAIDDGTYISYDVVEYKTGLAFEVPEGYEMELRPRSSISKHMVILCNSPGTLDSDYRGELTFRFRALSNRLPLYKKGDRIGQCKINEVLPVEWIESEELSETIRGTGGYGSTNEVKEESK